jgi:hypothetical protein
MAGLPGYFSPSANLCHASVVSEQQRGCSDPVRVWMLGDQGAVLLLVWDATMSAPVRRVATPDAEHGRGLTQVDALSHRWGFYHPAGPPGGPSARESRLGSAEA